MVKGNNKMSPRIITYIFVALILIALSIAILANSMTKPIGHDEQMYCTAAAMIAQGRMIYRDFSYVAQMPYHPLLCAALFKAVNTTYYLLTCRLLSAFCDILVIICIIAIYRRIFAFFPVTGLLLGLAAVILYVFNPFVDYANGFAWNHDVVILFVCLSFWLFVTTDFKQKSRYRPIALIGGLLSLASCMRITTALVQLLFLVVLMFRPAGSIKKRLKTVLPFFIGTAIVLIWPIRIMASAPRAFFLNVFRIPVLNSQWLHETGMVHDKYELTYSSLTTPAYLALIVIAVYLCTALLWNRRKLTITNLANPLLAALLAVTFFIIVYIPLTMWLQYLAMPVAFLVISFSFGLLYLKKLTSDKPFNIACVVIAVCVFIVVISYPVVLNRIPKLFHPQSWQPIRLHRISEDIARKTKEPKLILTLAPLYALEGGCGFYPQFSAGPFVYRIADALSEADHRVTNTVGPARLAQLLRDRPPSAVILGVEPELLEVPFLREAVRANWEKHIYDNGPVVYFKR